VDLHSTSLRQYQSLVYWSASLLVMIKRAQPCTTVLNMQLQFDKSAQRVVNRTPDSSNAATQTTWTNLSEHTLNPFIYTPQECVCVTKIFRTLHVAVVSVLKRVPLKIILGLLQQMLNRIDGTWSITSSLHPTFSICFMHVVICTTVQYFINYWRILHTRARTHTHISPIETYGMQHRYVSLSI
jgi:hypothetical protein